MTLYSLIDKKIEKSEVLPIFELSCDVLCVGAGGAGV